MPDYLKHSQANFGYYFYDASNNNRKLHKSSIWGIWNKQTQDKHIFLFWIKQHFLLI